MATNLSPMDEASSDSLAASLEVISEHIGAAFDAVNDVAEEVRRVETRIIDGLAALARALDEQLDQESVTTTLAAINRRLEGVGRVGPVLTDLAAWMAGIVNRQDKLEAEMVRLGDEVQAYRRRTQLKVRAPLLSDEQADSIVDKVLAGLALLAPPPSVEPERKRRR
jgi:hypothetical protein